jgi:FixJ family two-component response regulator
MVQRATLLLRQGERSGQVPREGTKPASANASERATAQEGAAQTLSALTDRERTLLEVLVTSSTARTVAQLSADSGLPRDQVMTTLANLRVKGLVTQFNTLIESYGARL